MWHKVPTSSMNIVMYLDITEFYISLPCSNGWSPLSHNKSVHQDLNVKITQNIHQSSIKQCDDQELINYEVAHPLFKSR